MRRTGEASSSDMSQRPAGWAGVGDPAAWGQQQHVVQAGEACRARLMNDSDNAAPITVCQLTQRVYHPVRVEGIQPGCGLVCEDDARPLASAASARASSLTRNCQPTTLPAADSGYGTPACVPANQGMCHFRQAEVVQQGGDFECDVVVAVSIPGLAAPTKLSSQLQSLLHREVSEERELLRYERQRTQCSLCSDDAA